MREIILNYTQYSENFENREFENELFIADNKRIVRDCYTEELILVHLRSSLNDIKIPIETLVRKF
jgi:hypothetical protein